MSRRRTTSRTTRRRAGAFGAAAVVGGAGSALLLSLTAAPAPATVSGTFTVDTLADGAANATDCTTPVPGSCSLRDALAAAGSGETVVFDPSLFTGGPQTITLDAGQGQLTDTEVDIHGPGSDLLTIDADDNSRVLFLNTLVSGTTISGLTVTGGRAGPGGGGGIKDGSSNLLVLEDVVVTGNHETNWSGAGVRGGSLRLVDSEVSGNTVTVAGGGGVFVTGSTYVRNSVFADNDSYGCGAGLYFGGSDTTLTVIDSTFSGNIARSCYGGGIDIDGRRNTVTIANSTFTDNSGTAGGGIHADDGNVVSIAMSTITGNDASTPESPYYSGGGVHISASASITLTGVVLAGNTSVSGGTADLAIGFAGLHPAVTVTAPASLVGDVSANVTLTGAGLLRGTDPQLGPLADNGGPTPTMLPLAGSPLLDHGPASIPDFPGNTYDQRGPGHPRTSGTASDIGAVEVTIPEPEPIPEPTFTG